MTLQHPGEPNPNEPKRYSRLTEFGGARDRGSGYLAYSDRIGPGVLLLHEFFGLTDAFKAYCDALNAEGFTALAPDLYDGRIATTVEEAEALSGSLDQEHTMKRLRAAVEHLQANWHPRVGVIGFSLGAWLAGQLAQETPLDATVLYYGTADAGERWNGPVLAHLAEVDEWEPLEEMRARMIGLEDAGIDVEAHVYPGTTHWFANRDVTDAFDAEASGLAWERTIEFFRHHLA